MPRTTHIFRTTIEIAGIERDIEIEYGFTPGAPERGLSYASGGEPAEGPEFDVISASLNLFTRSTISGQLIGRWEVAPSWFDEIIQEAINAEHISQDDLTENVR